MKIDLTYKCSMGCNHCLSDCKPDGESMSIDILNKVMDFIINTGIADLQYNNIVISGGEIFEHPQIKEMLDIVFTRLANKPCVISLATNGRILSDDIQMMNYLKDKMNSKEWKNRVFLQISDDDRFYPIRLTDKQKYRLKKLGGVLDGLQNFDNIHACLYPQGRALDNYDESWYFTRAPKCTNPRWMAKHYNIESFTKIVQTLVEAQKYCTPTISPKGEIKLGESALCPPVCSIDESDIIGKIKTFKCCKCQYAAHQLMWTNPLMYTTVFYEKDN